LTAYRREPVRAGAAPGRRTNAAEFPVDRRAGCPPRGPKDSRAPLADAAKAGANWPTGSARGTPGRRRQPGRKPHPTVDGGRRLSRTRAHCAPMAGPLPGRRDVADTVSTRAERAIEGRRKKLRTEGGVPTVERPRAFEGSHCGAPGVGPAPGREVPQDKRHTALHNDPFSQRLSASRRTGRKRWAAAAAAEDGRCRNNKLALSVPPVKRAVQCGGGKGPGRLGMIYVRIYPKCGPPDTERRQVPSALQSIGAV
jgi:hypothetical protein